MTEDYKEKLLKYITNNLSKETGTNIPEFSDIVSQDATSLYNTLNSAFQYGFKQNGVIQCKNVDGEYNGFIIVYGMYWTDNDKTDSLAKGYMLLFDNNFELVQLIKKYNSGTDCGIFMKIIVLNDGTLVALDHFDSRNRILLLNNPSIKLPSQENYILKLRTSYNLQGNVQNISYTMNGKSYLLDKDPNSANYMIGAYDNSTLFEGLTQLTINVGSSNTWTDFTYSKPTPYNTNIQDVIHTYIYWQDSKPQLYVYDSYTGYRNSNEMWYYTLYKIRNNANSTTLNQVSLIWNWGIDNNNRSLGAAINFISPEKYYFTFAIGYENYEDDNNWCSIYTWLMDNDNYIRGVYGDDFLLTSTTGIVSGYFDIDTYNLNGTQCLIYSTITERLASFTPMKTVGVLITSNDESASKVLATPYYETYNQFHINTIINQFDLYKYYIITDDFDAGMKLNRSDIIYNYLYYNGPAYENVNSLRANQGMLYDVNGNIFVRGIYNHVVSDNMTEDTIQIPNTMVNDIQITKNKLMSQTNVPMVINEDTIEKNIYETLYINYFNTINVENQNKTYTIPNKVGAIRVNEAISGEFDYDDMTITKYRINYADETTLTKPIESCIIEDGIATFTLSMYVDKEVESIDLISDDELTTYQTITDDFVIGNFYTITQDCYVE